jgi:hypothetical protein
MDEACGFSLQVVADRAIATRVFVRVWSGILDSKPVQYRRHEMLNSGSCSNFSSKWRLRAMSDSFGELRLARRPRHSRWASAPHHPPRRNSI